MPIMLARLIGLTAAFSAAAYLSSHSLDDLRQEVDFVREKFYSKTSFFPFAARFKKNPLNTEKSVAKGRLEQCLKNKIIMASVFHPRAASFKPVHNEEFQKVAGQEQMMALTPSTPENPNKGKGSDRDFVEFISKEQHRQDLAARDVCWMNRCSKLTDDHQATEKQSREEIRVLTVKLDLSNIVASEIAIRLRERECQIEDLKQKLATQVAQHSMKENAEEVSPFLPEDMPEDAKVDEAEDKNKDSDVAEGEGPNESENIKKDEYLKQDKSTEENVATEEVEGIIEEQLPHNDPEGQESQDEFGEIDIFLDEAFFDIQALDMDSETMNDMDKNETKAVNEEVQQEEVQHEEALETGAQHEEQMQAGTKYAEVDHGEAHQAAGQHEGNEQGGAEYAEADHGNAQHEEKKQIGAEYAEAGNEEAQQEATEHEERTQDAAVYAGPDHGEIEQEADQQDAGQQDAGQQGEHEQDEAEYAEEGHKEAQKEQQKQDGAEYAGAGHEEAQPKAEDQNDTHTKTQSTPTSAAESERSGISFGVESSETPLKASSSSSLSGEVNLEFCNTAVPISFSASPPSSPESLSSGLSSPSNGNSKGTKEPATVVKHEAKDEDHAGSEVTSKIPLLRLCALRRKQSLLHAKKDVSVLLQAVANTVAPDQKPGRVQSPEAVPESTPQADGTQLEKNQLTEKDSLLNTHEEKKGIKPKSDEGEEQDEAYTSDKAQTAVSSSTDEPTAPSTNFELPLKDWPMRTPRQRTLKRREERKRARQAKTASKELGKPKEISN